MRIFITGGSGLLGSKLAEIALGKGHGVFSGDIGSFPMKGKAIKSGTFGRRFSWIEERQQSKAL